MIDDLALGQAEGPRRADVVLAHDLEHRGAHEAREVADPAETDRERGQHEVIELIAEHAGLARADRREPLERDGEDEQRVERDDERRHRDDADRQRPRQLVEQAVAPDRREAAERNAEHDGPADARRRKRGRVRQRLEDDLGDAAVTPDVEAEVAAEHTREEVEELHGDGLVEPHARAQRFLHLGRRPRAEGDRGGVAGDEIDHPEQDRHGDRDDHHGEPDSAQRVEPHQPLRLWRPRACRPA